MRVITNNKSAYHNFHISEKYEAGIVLEGCEVKSIRNGGVSINESFIVIENGELFLKNAFIKPYDKTSAFLPDAKRNRKLLLHKKEISKIFKQKSMKGMTVIPLKVYLTDKGLVKIEIAVAKGKKLYDKRETLKENSAKKEIDRVMKNAVRGW